MTQISLPPVQVVSMSRQERLIILCVCLAAFTFQFEAFVINVALPSMASELGVTSTEISFAVLVYLLATTIALVPAGKLGYRFGLRRTFLFGCALAAIATLVCGVSTSLPMLLVSRFCQGLGIGIIVANAYAMIPVWIGQAHAGRGFGLLSLGASIGMVAGLPVGGLLSDALSWHWIFLTTVPFFVGLFWLALCVLPKDYDSARPRVRLDWIGLFTFGLMLGCATLTLSLGAELGWHSNAIISLFALTLFSAGYMLLRRNAQVYLFSPALFKTSALIPSLWVLFIFSMTIGGLRFLLPFYLQLGCGLSVFASSVFLLAYPISFAPAGVWSGQLADRIDSRRLIIFSCLGVALLCLVFAWFFSQLGLWFFMLFVLCFGFTSGLFFAPNNRFCMSHVPDALKGEASALLPVALNMGTLIGVSVFETVFTLNLPDGAMFIQDNASRSNALLSTLTPGLRDALIVAVLLLSAAALLVRLTYYPKVKTNNIY